MHRRLSGIVDRPGRDSPAFHLGTRLTMPCECHRPGSWIVLLLLFASSCRRDPSPLPPSAETSPTGSPAAGNTPLPAETDPARILPSELRQRLGISEEHSRFERVGGRIEFAYFERSGVQDLKPMQGIRLRGLEMASERVADLSPLASNRLERLFLVETDVSDLSPFRGSPIELLVLERSPIQDISPVISPALQQAQLVELPLEDLAPLAIARPSYLWIEKTQVRDLSPLADLAPPRLGIKDSPVADLSPLRGKTFDELNLSGTAVQDLEPVRTMRLGILWLRGTPVTDLSPLAAAQLTSLDVQDTPVADLRPLAAATTLQRLNIAGTQVTDLSPILGLPLTRLIFTPSRITVGMDQLRQMTTLRELDVQFEPDQRAAWTPREFWTRYDAGEFRSSDASREPNDDQN